MDPFFEARAWRIATQLVRRAPAELLLLETDFQDGFYRFLSVVPAGFAGPAQAHRQRLADVNLHGAMVNLPARTLPQDLDARVRDPVLLFDRAPAVYRDLTQLMGLPDPKPLPPSTPQTLSYRFIVAWLQLHSSLGCPYRVWHGVSPAGTVRAHDLAAFPGAELDPLGALPADRPVDLQRWHAAHEYWILAASDAPIACAGSDGVVLTTDGSSFDVQRLYHDSGRNIWSAVAAVRSHLEQTGMDH